MDSGSEVSQGDKVVYGRALPTDRSNVKMCRSMVVSWITIIMRKPPAPPRQVAAHGPYALYIYHQCIAPLRHPVHRPQQPCARPLSRPQAGPPNSVGRNRRRFFPDRWRVHRMRLARTQFSCFPRSGISNVYACTLQRRTVRAAPSSPLSPPLCSERRGMSSKTKTAPHTIIRKRLLCSSSASQIEECWPRRCWGGLVQHHVHHDDDCVHACCKLLLLEDCT